MDLCEHINGFNSALKHFSGCFDSHLKLKEHWELKLENRFNTLRGKSGVEYEEILFGSSYVMYLSGLKKVFNDIHDYHIKALYLRYEDTLNYVSKRRCGYNYLFLLCLLKRPILEILRSIDSKIYCFPQESKSKELNAFISKWNQLLSSDYNGYNYIDLNIFISELNDISSDNPILMGYNKILEGVLIQINNNPYVFRKTK